MILWNVKYHYLNCHEFVAFLALTFKFPCKYHIILIWIFNPTFHRGGGVHPTPPKVLVSRAFQSYLRDHKCWHNSWYLEFVLWKKIIFFSFFSFFWHPQQTKWFFCTFGTKITYNNLLTYKWTFHPQKMLFRGLFYKVSSKRPPLTTLTFQSCVR